MVHRSFALAEGDMLTFCTYIKLRLVGVYALCVDQFQTF